MNIGQPVDHGIEGCGDCAGSLDPGVGMAEIAPEAESVGVGSGAGVSTSAKRSVGRMDTHPISSRVIIRIGLLLGAIPSTRDRA